MDDDRVRDFEQSLWIGDADNYRKLVDAECLMVLPTPPYVLSGQQAIDAVIETPRWLNANLGDLRIARPEEGLIVVAYHVTAERDEDKYEAHCTSTYRRRGHDDWQVVQHQQTPPLSMSPTK